MKDNKDLLGIIVGCLVLLLLACGCQHEEEYIEQPTVQEQQDAVDLEILEQEYKCMIALMDQVFNTLSTSENLTMTEVTSLLKYVSKNRIEPTQKLTIELDELIDEVIKISINYYTTTDEERGKELELELLNVFQQLEEKCLEIELLLNTVEI